MSKILTDKEMIDIIKRAPDEIDERDSYMHFLEALADLICDHFGGTRNEPFNDLEEGDGYGCAFNVNECVPDDGGIFKLYDKDVLWKDGKETEPVKKLRIR
jgi:hypothetical protein